MLTSFLPAVLAVIVLSTAGRADLPYAALAARLADALALQPGEKLVTLCQPGRFDVIQAPLEAEVDAAGATYLGCITDTADTDAPSPLIAEADAFIALPGATPDQPSYRAMQARLNAGAGRSIHFHWTGAYSANMALLPVTDAVDTVYTRAVLETDCTAMAAAQARFVAAAREKIIRVTTPAGTDLRLMLAANQPVNRQDCDASDARMTSAKILIDREVEIPGGAVRFVAVPDSVSGKIVFPDSDWNGVRAEAATFHFVRGHVTRFNAATNADAVRQEIEDGKPASQHFREFALGFNPLLAVPDGENWTPYYGYGAGVVRLSLGDNIELGGDVSGGYVRWSFFTDATVTIDGDVWVKNGALVK